VTFANIARCFVATLLVPARLFAHESRAVTPENLLSFRAPELIPVTVLLVFAWLYARGVRALWKRAGRAAGISRTQATLFGLGWTVLALSTVSPLHALGGALFSAHMVQHELLVVIAAPLLVLGKPVAAFAWAVPQQTRQLFRHMFAQPLLRGRWRAARGIPGATIIHALVLWLWHIPALYEWSIHNSAAHAFQHATFLGSALLFWSATLPRAIAAPNASANNLAATAALFATVLHTGVLGALITLSSRLWYTHYGTTSAAWGLMPMEDQQLAGLVMWIPGSVVYIVVALIRSSAVISMRATPRGRIAAV
jgi:putative membrane protein